MAVRDVLYSTSMENCGPTVRKHQDWFDQNNTKIQALLDEKHRLELRRHQCSENHGTQTTGPSPLLSADGSTLLTEKAEIQHRWSEHFDSVLNRPSIINEDLIAQILQVKMNTSFDDPPTIADVGQAIAAPLQMARLLDLMPSQRKCTRLVAHG